MKQRFVILASLFVAMFSYATAADECFVDIGFFVCDSALEESCPAQAPCIGNFEVTLSDQMGNRLEVSETGGWDLEYGVSVWCATVKSCILQCDLENFECWCEPEEGIGAELNIILGTLNWESECQPST